MELGSYFLFPQEQLKNKSSAVALVACPHAPQSHPVISASSTSSPTMPSPALRSHKILNNWDEPV